MTNLSVIQQLEKTHTPYMEVMNVGEIGFTVYNEGNQQLIHGLCLAQP